MTDIVERADISARATDWRPAARSVRRAVVGVCIPVLSILALWYLAIAFSGLPSFVIPRPERVLQTLYVERALIGEHLLYTLEAALLGFVFSNVLGVGLAVLFVALPASRAGLMPAAITIRNIPYVALVSVLALAVGDGILSKVIIVVLAGFFPVLVNTYRGLLSADPVVLDRMKMLDASRWDTFTKVRLRFALPYLVAAQEITGSGSIIVAIAAEWMISSNGLGYLINRGVLQYRGDEVYAVALLAALLSYGIYCAVQAVGNLLDHRRPQNG